MRSISNAERRARLARLHHLDQTASSPTEVARSMVGLHSSDPATVFLSLQARVDAVSPADIEKSLYTDKTLVRILGMRRTMWATATDLAPLVNSSSTSALVQAQQKRTALMIESSGIAENGDVWVKAMSRDVLEVLTRRGEASARELTEDLPELGQKLTFYKRDGSVVGEVGASTRILFLLATEGRVVRTRPLGTWVSSQYRWSPMENWLGKPLGTIEREDAQARIIERWLMAFGPATETDMKWWTGWTMTQVRQSLERIGAVIVNLETGTGFVTRKDDAPVSAQSPWVALLPSLDPTTMGWRERDWYLGDHYPILFDRNGNAGPTVWVDGRVVGGWAQRKTGEIVYELIEDVGREAAGSVESRASELQNWIGEVRVTPRFRSPHDKSLTG